MGDCSSVFCVYFLAVDEQYLWHPQDVSDAVKLIIIWIWHHCSTNHHEKKSPPSSSSTNLDYFLLAVVWETMVCMLFLLIQQTFFCVKLSEAYKQKHLHHLHPHKQSVMPEVTLQNDLTHPQCFSTRSVLLPR